MKQTLKVQISENKEYLIEISDSSFAKLNQEIYEFTRFQKKQSFDAYVQAKIAGAKDLEEVENWMEDIHS